MVVKSAGWQITVRQRVIRRHGRNQISRDCCAGPARLISKQNEPIRATPEAMSR